MTDRFLMCAPEHFDIAYVINPWMQGNVARCNAKTANLQWQTLMALMGKVAQIEHVSQEAGVPDMVFTANAGLVFDAKFVLSRFHHVERQAEEPLFAQWFAAHGFDVIILPPGMPFEGAGDALFDRASNLLWLGHGHRSSAQCALYLANLLAIDVEPLKLVNEHFYHLDTCFCPLQGGDLMYYPPAFDADSQARIAARVPLERRIVVSDADAMDFACNAVNCGQHIFVNRMSAGLLGTLKTRGFIVQQTPLTEFMKAGGSAKCLTLKLNEMRHD